MWASRSPQAWQRTRRNPSTAVSWPGVAYTGVPSFSRPIGMRATILNRHSVVEPSAAFRQRASYSVAVSHQQSTNLVADPPYTPQFEGRPAPFATEVSSPADLDAGKERVGAARRRRLHQIGRSDLCDAKGHGDLGADA